VWAGSFVGCQGLEAPCRQFRKKGAPTPPPQAYAESWFLHSFLCAYYARTEVDLVGTLVTQGGLGSNSHVVDIKVGTSLDVVGGEG
jgi:hypothetical protein